MWFKLGAVFIVLSLIISGCGILDEAEPSQQAGELSAKEITRIEAAVERAESAAERVEAVTQRIEGVAEQYETLLEQTEAIPAETEDVAADSEVSPTEPDERLSSAPEPAPEPEESLSSASEPDEGLTSTNRDPIKIGLVVDLNGIYVTGGRDAIRTVEMAVAEFGGQINGRPIELIVEGSDSTAPDLALAAARKLIEEDQVDIVIGPSSSDEGLVIRDYAKDYPHKTFLNGTSAAQDITLRDPAPNYFRFSTDGVQWMAGLGEYVYKEKGYHRIAILADDYSFNYTHVGGFLINFCEAGGEVVEKFWTPIDATDYSNIIEIIPSDIDAMYVSLGGTNSLNFIRQFDEAGRQLPIIAGSVTLDQSVLNAEGEMADYIVGAAAAGPIADNSPDEVWQAYVAMYREMFPDGLPSPSLFGSTYYVNAKAALLALEKVEGDLSDDQQAFQEALRNLEYDSPMGRLRLDENRQVIGSNFITEVARNEEGTLYNKFIKEVAGIDQTLGLGHEVFVGLGRFGPNNPLCDDIRTVVANESQGE